jgi:hypothetical protein
VFKAKLHPAGVQKRALRDSSRRMGSGVCPKPRRERPFPPQFVRYNFKHEENEKVNDLFFKSSGSGIIKKGETSNNRA